MIYSIHMKNLLRSSLVIMIINVLLSVYSGDAFCLGKGSKHYIKARTPQQLKDIFRYTGDSVSFISSHRGGPEADMPENCIATFSNTLKHVWSVMEIDPRYTKDSVLVVHHDPTLQRTTTGKGRVSDYTYKELQKLRLKDTKGNATKYRISTLNEIFKWAKGKTILILDKKEVSMEDRIKAVEENHAEAYTMIMAYTFEEAKLCYSRNKNIMMEVFIPNPAKVMEFDKTGVPWENVVAFVSHQMPSDLSVFQLIHERGALCILGTSRNLDRQIITNKVNDPSELKSAYNSFYKAGVDILETDIPVPVSKIVADRLSSKTWQSKYLKP